MGNASVLILLGGFFGAIVGIVGGAIIIGVMPRLGWLGGLIIVRGLLGLIFGILVIIGVIMIDSGERNKVKTGSVIVLIFSILSLFVGGFGGFVIGFILGLVGGILGLTWKPSEETPPAPPTL